MTKAVCALAGVLLATAAAGAERAKSPAEATVFIRLTGDVHIEIDDGTGIKRTVDREHVEIGSGSGFVISPHGYVLTNDHVVSGEQVLVTRGVAKARATLTVTGIQVCFAAAAAQAHGLVTPCLPGSVTAADPALDLAVVFVGASNLPYVAFGDSDIVPAGQPVDALGYPFGADVELARVATAPNIVPEVSLTTGTVSAARADAAGDRRYLQITNALNPGNSGGPIVTREGFAIGVTRSKLKDAEGIGFAIAINQVKDFLESRGLDQALPVRRLRAGAFHNLEAKGIGVQMPAGLADATPHPSRVETDRSVDVVLRIDRVRSAWPLRQIEQALVQSESFEPLVMTPRTGREASPSTDPRRLAGAATAATSGGDFGVEYGIVDLGPEKLVARYVGPLESIMFNESVLRESLSSVQGLIWGTRDLAPPDRLEWSAATVGDAAAVAVPAGWPTLQAAPHCAGLPQAAMISAPSPEDFGLTLNVAAWTGVELAPETAASACSTRRGAFGAASYLSRASWLGVTYVTQGVFVESAPRRVLQFEVSSTEDRSGYAEALIAAWLKQK